MVGEVEERTFGGAGFEVEGMRGEERGEIHLVDFPFVNYYLLVVG